MTNRTTISAGQTWMATRAGSRARPRHIVWATDRGHPSLRWIDYGTVGFRFDMNAHPAFPETGHDSWLSRESFRNWIRKHAAICKEQPHA